MGRTPVYAVVGGTQEGRGVQLRGRDVELHGSKGKLAQLCDFLQQTPQQEK